MWEAVAILKAPQIKDMDGYSPLPSQMYIRWVKEVPVTGCAVAEVESCGPRFDKTGPTSARTFCEIYIIRQHTKPIKLSTDKFTLLRKLLDILEDLSLSAPIALYR